MSDRCAACGEQTVFEAEVGCALCPHCGTLADPDQHILDAHLEHVDVSGHDYRRPLNAGASTLKGRRGWALAGQDKEARDRRNTISMHEFVRTLAGRLASPGAAVRAQNVFDQAMERGAFRWGRRARLVAGAALAVTLREAHKSDSLRDIAYLLDEPHLAVARTFSAVTELLHLKLALADPAQHLPTLEDHLRGLIQLSDTAATTTSLPVDLTAALTPLLPHLRTVRTTASSLSAFVACTPTLASLPTAPTACALLLLALEAERGAPLPSAGTLAAALGARVGASGAVVMQRYRAVGALVEEGVGEVPWLVGRDGTGKGKDSSGNVDKKRGKNEGKGQGKEAAKSRAKVAKRAVVARGLKDVLQFREEIWRKRFEGVERPVVVLDGDADEDASGSDADVGDRDERSQPAASSSSRSSPSAVLPTHIRAQKTASAPRRSAPTREMQRASQFLLNPSAASAPTRPELLAHLLTADAPPGCTPTRLQMLAAARGGAGEDAVGDEELFGEGEMEGLMRGAEEVAAMRIALGWDEDEEDGDGESEEEKVGRKRKKRAGGSEKDVGEGSARGAKKTKTTKRIDMDALARLLDPENHLEDHVEELSERDWDEDVDGFADGPYTFSPDAEEVVEDWRPLSPGPGGSFDEDRYEC